MRMDRTIKWRSLALAAALLAAGVVLSLWQIKPPPADKDSAAWRRMMDNVRQMAVEPHPAGSEEIEAVRALLLGEIEEMGLSPIIEDEVYTGDEMIEASMLAQNTTLEEWWWDNRDWVEQSYGITDPGDFFSPRMGDDGTLLLKNILIPLDAPDTDRGVMFVTHYDSTSNGPGAADDMAAVCAALEALRAHAQEDTLKNDLYFLFTDGEEDALLGARRFVSAHPELREKVDLVVNFEARGNRGGLLLFETSPKAYSLLEAVIQSGAKPIGFSWLAAVYSMMPNITDLTVFLEDGYQSVNFAVAQGVEAYHEPEDSFENLDSSSAWQYLSTTLALADYAAGHSLEKLRQPSEDAVYFPFLPGVTVLFSYRVSHLFCAAACALSLLYGILQIKNKRLKLSFPTVLMGLLLLLSIGCEVIFTPGSYLFYLPLFLMALTGLMKNRPAAHLAAKLVSGGAALLLWVPVVFLLWISLVQPLMLT